MQPKVAITGLGVISPLGLGVESFWNNLCQGNSGIDRITAFDPSSLACPIGGQAPEYSLKDYVPKSYRKATKLMCRDIELAVVAAYEAVVSAGLKTAHTDPDNKNIIPEKSAINLGAGLISADLEELAGAVATAVVDGKFDIHKWGAEGMNTLTPLWLLKYLPNMLACHIGIIHDFQGPSNTITCCEVSSHIAVSEACQQIQRGTSQIALAGGGEAKVNPVVLLRQCLLKRTAEKLLDKPKEACRPFDKDASGCVFGEGAAVLTLENIEQATARDAQVYAIVAGSGQSSSLNPDFVHLEADGKGVCLAIKSAMADAGIKPEDIDLIIPHGTGIPQDDIAESKGIISALGNYGRKIPVLPIKAAVSNTGAASGAMDLIAGVMAIKNSFVPCALNFSTAQNGVELNINTKPIEKEIKTVLCVGYTYGGQTAAVILKKWDK